jgi:hypothetical protein
MDRPMRVNGRTLYEVVHEQALAGVGPLLVALGVAAAIWPGALLPASTALGGLLAGAAATAGVCLTLAGAGLYQNRAALDVGSAIGALSALAWLVWGIAAGPPAAIAIGIVLLVVIAALIGLRRRAARARSKPRFFTPRAFETMIQIADTMIDGDGREAISPVQVAIHTDHLLADVEADAKGEIRLLMVIVEWVLPLRILRPLPFSTLGSVSRRRLVDKVIGSTGLFRDVARTLKVLASAGYYGDPQTMRRIGYLPFDERARSVGVDQSPLQHPDPFEDREAVA